MPKKWTPEEEAVLRDHYPSHGPNWDGWAGLLPDRTPKSVGGHANIIGLRVDPEVRYRCPNNGWTDEEDQIVREHYPDRGTRWDGWERLLPNRTVVAIQSRASVLGVRVKPHVATRSAWRTRRANEAERREEPRADVWTAAQTRLLLVTLADLAEVTGHSPVSVVSHIQDLHMMHVRMHARERKSA